MQVKSCTEQFQNRMDIKTPKISRLGITQVAILILIFSLLFPALYTLRLDYKKGVTRHGSGNRRGSFRPPGLFAV